MTGVAWITFVVVTGFVWGGFATLVVLALRKERRKLQQSETSDS
ncbi:MAG: hypothetical protein P8Y29_01225 [Gemmatimonadota bacterium]